MGEGGAVAAGVKVGVVDSELLLLLVNWSCSGSGLRWRGSGRFSCSVLELDPLSAAGLLLLLLLLLLLGTTLENLRSLVLRRRRIAGARFFLMGCGKRLMPLDLVEGPGCSGVASGVESWAEWKEESELGAYGEAWRRRRSWRRSVAGVGGVWGVRLGEGRNQ